VYGIKPEPKEVEKEVKNERRR